MNLLNIKADHLNAERTYEGKYIQEIGGNKQNKYSTSCKTSINQLMDNSFTAKIG